MQHLYQWPPEHHDAIRRIFTLKGRGALKGALSNLRDKGGRLKKKTLFMGEEIWRQIEEKWKDPAWKAKSELGKKAKTSEAGRGKAANTGGFITTEEHRILEVYFHFNLFFKKSL